MAGMEMMAMKAFLVEGYLDALKGLGAAVKLFWPILVLFLALFVTAGVVGNFKITWNFQMAPLASIALLVCFLGVFAYVFILFCQGAVGWHRRLLLHEAPAWASLLPSRRSLQYALPAFLFGVVVWGALLLFSALVLPQMAAWLAASIRGLNLTANPTIEQLEAFRRATIPIILSILISMIVMVGAIVWGGRSWLMIFPHVSVRAGEPAWGAIKDGVRQPPGFLGALMVAMFLPSLLSTLYQSVLPMSVQILPAAALAASIVSVPFAVLSPLCGLSILSIAYRKAEVNKMTFVDVNREAQN